MRPSLLALIAALLTLALTSATASGARLERIDGANVFTAVGADKVNLLVRAGNSSNLFNTFASGVGATIPTSVAPCSGSVLGSCPHKDVNNPAPVTKLRFVTTGGDDKITAADTLRPFDASLPEEFVTGAGADVLVAGPRNDDVRAGVDADTITGGPGADVLRGEQDDDTFLRLDGADKVVGGDGVDLLDLTALATGVSISLDRTANDGPLGSSADVDVENLRGTPFGDLLTGGDGANRLEAGGGIDVIDVRGGGADAADCGGALGDRALVDPADTTVDCEIVDLEQPAAPGGADGAGAGAGGVGAPAAQALDGDRDGVLPPADCDDTAAARHPGARDIPGNKIDEDCSGSDAPLSVVPARVAFEWFGFRDGTQAKNLRVRGVPADGKVLLRCTRGCGFKRRAARVSAAGSANLAKLLGKRRLAAGVVVEIRIAAPEHITKITRFRMRGGGRQPVRSSLCLQPGQTRPGRC